MRNGTRLKLLLLCLSSTALCSCSYYSGSDQSSSRRYRPYNPAEYQARLPSTIATNEKVVVVDPRAHAWGAYNADGTLAKAGVATSGRDFCPDTQRGCRTSVGTFRVSSLGAPDCKSHIFPKPNGGAPMPYCMYFHGGQALHGTAENEVGDANLSHGCVRMHVADAEWLRYNFVNVGTKVVVKPY